MTDTVAGRRTINRYPASEWGSLPDVAKRAGTDVVTVARILEAEGLRNREKCSDAAAAEGWAVAVESFRDGSPYYAWNVYRCEDLVVVWRGKADRVAHWCSVAMGRNAYHYKGIPEDIVRDVAEMAVHRLASSFRPGKRSADAVGTPEDSIPELSVHLRLAEKPELHEMVMYKWRAACIAANPGLRKMPGFGMYARYQKPIYLLLAGKPCVGKAEEYPEWAPEYLLPQTAD